MDCKVLTKIGFINKPQPECELTYMNGETPTKYFIEIDEVHDGQAEFFPAVEEECIEFHGDKTIIRLTAENLARVSKWYSENSEVPVSLPIQKI